MAASGRAPRNAGRRVIYSRRMQAALRDNGRHVEPPEAIAERKRWIAAGAQAEAEGLAKFGPVTGATTISDVREFNAWVVSRRAELMR